MVESLTIGNVSASKGETKCGVLEGVELYDGARMDIPVIVANGTMEGPTFLIASDAVNARNVEVQGIEVIRRVMREEVDVKKLKGSIIGIPLSNPLAFQSALTTTSAGDGNMFNTAADSPDGTTTERLANAQWEQAWSKADYAINLYARTPENSVVYQSKELRPPETREALLKMSAAYGITDITYDGNPLPEDDDTQSLHHMAMSKGVPVLLVELLSRMGTFQHSVDVGVRGVLNVLKVLGMIEGEVEKQEGIPVVPGQCKYHGEVYSQRGGILYPAKEPGERVKKGEVLARVLNIYGDLVETIVMPVDGYLWAMERSNYSGLGSWDGVQAVNAGGAIAQIFAAEGEG